MITTIGILIGAALSTRYKVLCLVPAILAGAAVLAVIERVNGATLGSIALTALALAIGLQVGYLIGGVVRPLIVAALAGTVSESKRLRNQSARMY